MHSDSNPMNAYLDGERHIFVDNVRFWSMIGIVAIHSASVFIVIENTHPLLIAALLAPAKFGTIGFFLISGFLLASVSTDTGRWNTSADGCRRYFFRGCSGYPSLLSL